MFANTLAINYDENINTGRDQQSFWGRFSPDIVFFCSFLILCNFHLIIPDLMRPLIFNPADFMAGKWWLIFTYSFVHVSWYHLLLDAGAFMLLYTGLETRRISKRLFYTAGCGVCSFGATLLFAPEIESLGLCGISGIAHGLMAVTALEMIAGHTYAKQGWLCLFIVGFKSLYEIIVGEMLFSFLLFGMCGIPLAASHIGGVIGGIISFMLAAWLKPLCIGTTPNNCNRSLPLRSN